MLAYYFEEGNAISVTQAESLLGDDGEGTFIFLPKPLEEGAEGACKIASNNPMGGGQSGFVCLPARTMQPPWGVRADKPPKSLDPKHPRLIILY